MTTAAGPAPGPFDPPAAAHAEAPTHLVLENTRTERSLWPAHTAAPDGWHAAHGPAPYEECTAHLERTAAGA
jgi:uncharacterized protein YbdZ (MbtH family)